MTKKFEFTNETIITPNGTKLHRIVALIDFNDVKAGQLGGFVQYEDNLSHNGNAWVYGNACVFDNAKVYGDSLVTGRAKVYGDACVFDNAKVYGDASVTGRAKVHGNSCITSGVYMRCRGDR